MNYFNVLEARKSIRAYTDTPVKEAHLERIFQAVNQAPSAGNLQAFEIYLVTNVDQRMQLAKAALDQEFIAQAPVVLIFCTHADRSAVRYSERGNDLYCLQDATIACTYAMLSATALGLSSVWIGAFNESQVSTIIGTHPGHRPVAMLPIGFAAEEPRVKSRRKLDDFIHRVK